MEADPIFLQTSGFHTSFLYRAAQKHPSHLLPTTEVAIGASEKHEGHGQESRVRGTRSSDRVRLDS